MTVLMMRPSNAPEVAEQREPVHHRHIDVGDHQVELGIGGDPLQRLLAVLREDEFEVAVAALEAAADQGLDIRLVVDDQNARRARLMRAPRGAEA